MAKTEHLSTRENPLPMEVNEDELKNVDHFKYLGSVIDRGGTIDRDVDLGVRAAWSSLRKLTGVLYDRKIPLRLKAKVYEAIIRPALTYGSECWAMKVTNKRKIATTHGDEDASRDPRSVQTRPHAERGYPTHYKYSTDRRGYALWPSLLVWTCP